MSEPVRHNDGRGRVAAGVVGSLVGLAAAGVAAGLAGQRALLRRRKRERDNDPHCDEPFGELPADEYRTVTTAEGIPLHVEINGPKWARTTVILVHGFCLDMGTFHFQRSALSRVGGIRVISYDQPGHGRSGRLPAGAYTLDMLASALRKVIDECAPADSRVVLVGHSMGGMTIMALAQLAPDLFAPGGRIARVALISTSAGGVTFGLPDLVRRFRGSLLPLISGAGTATATVVDRARAASKDLAWLLTRKYGFGKGVLSQSLVSYVEQMNGATPTESVARYLTALYGHQCDPSLSGLKHVPVLVICGEEDQITPVAHSRALAQDLPQADLQIVPDAGHVVPLEACEAVNAALLPFVRKIGP